MSVIYLMIPAALLLAALGVGAFIIAAKKGQFDDLDTPALRAVFDDDETPPDRQSETSNLTNKDA
ncbi:MAG: cbb3-type cytochrome oxidase assembly protein CcoS [Phycisphaerales bacterium]|nr:cbb3-type cytochrome oxidase assembly protein CcoS [Phycisphaerales bacterium]